MNRFIKEYANYKINKIKSNELIKEDLKSEAVEKIQKVLKLEKSGLITVDEAISNILNCL